MPNFSLNDWNRLLKNSIRLAITTLGEHDVVPVSEEHLAQGTALSLFARTISNSRASLKLLEDGYVVEARILLRCVIENTAIQSALQQDADKTIGLLKENWERGKDKRLKLMKQQIELSDWQKDYVDKSFEDYAKKYNGKQARNVIFKNMIDATKLPNMYLHYMQLSADAVHPDSGALYEHVRKEGDSFYINFRVNHDENARAQTISLLSINILLSGVRLCAMIGDEVNGEKFLTRINEYISMVKG